MTVGVEDMEEGYYGINVTPLVDITLVLLLIFMVTSPFFIKELIPVRLPEAVTSKAESRENLTISISPSEGFAINEEKVLRGNLFYMMKKKIEETGCYFVLIRADERVPHGDVAYVMKLAKRAGIKSIAFGTTPKVR